MQGDNMKKLFLLAVLILFLTFGTAWAANTINPTSGTANGVIELSSIDSDWSWTDAFGSADHGQPLQSITFLPGAADDFLSVKEGSATGPEIFPPVKCADEYDVKVKYFNGVIRRPVLDISASTISAGGLVIFEFGKP
jgi:hypothetical protein